MAKHLLKKEQRMPETKKSSLSITLTYKHLAIFLVLAAAAFAAYWLFVLPDAPSIQVSPEGMNLGNVSVASGTKNVSFSLSNAGKSDLIIAGMVTSCMCTSASLTVDGQESPRFGMHDNASGWQQAIKPGQAATLNVYYDPTVHPELRGPVTRTISISSNDPLFSTKKITITANQVS
jgi:hypothetical protein